MDEARIRQLIRQRLAERRLLRSRAISIRETSGHGWPCDVCDELIGPKQTAVLARVSRDWETVVFHMDCYKLWDAERLALAGSVEEADPANARTAATDKS